MIRELREENEKLKKVLIQIAQGGPINLKELGVGDLSELIETMDENSKAMEDMQKPWHEKLQEEKEKDRETLMLKSKREDRRVPHLTNLSDDEQINGKACYSLLDCKINYACNRFLTLGPVYVGRKTGNPKPQIILGGVGIRTNHAYFEQRDDGFIYIKASEEEALDQIQINGEKIEENEEGIAEQRLYHLDRILLGSNTLLVFKYPLLKRKLMALKETILSLSQCGEMPEEDVEK